MIKPIIAAALVAAVLFPSSSRADYIEVPSRGLKIPALLLKPEQPSTIGVILYAGGLGRLNISSDGSIGMLRGNQLVRTREGYRRAGFLTLVPDIATDMKSGASGAVERYRETKAYADDMGAMVATLRSAGATKVVVIGTSRGTLSVANGVSKLGAGPRRPNAQVLTSGFWKVGASARGFTIWKLAGQGNARSMNLPTQLVWHRDDGCSVTRAADVPAFRKWLEGGGAKVAVKEFSGGLPSLDQDPCEARAPHGFFGLDDQVVEAISGWIRQLP
jgi:dienelactone hydrolase